MGKLTFKKDKKESGTGAIGWPWPNTRIKFDGQVIGVITAPGYLSKNRLWTISITVRRKPTANNPSVYTRKNIGTQHICNSEMDARLWIKMHQDEIMALGLYGVDDCDY
jgi:hypothetical protein